MERFGWCIRKLWSKKSKFFMFFEKSQTILGLLFSGGNLGPGKLCPLCVRISQMKKSMYNKVGKIWVMHSEVVIEKSDNFSFFLFLQLDWSLLLKRTIAPYYFLKCTKVLWNVLILLYSDFLHFTLNVWKLFPWRQNNFSKLHDAYRILA